MVDLGYSDEILSEFQIISLIGAQVVQLKDDSLVGRTHWRTYDSFPS